MADSEAWDGEEEEERSKGWSSPIEEVAQPELLLLQWVGTREKERERERTIEEGMYGNERVVWLA